MDQIQYIGEHLWPGRLGHFMVVLSFVAALLSAFSYLFSKIKRDRSWEKLGRISFLIQGIGVVGIMSMILYMMFMQFYEYSYVQAHVDEELPFRYILSAFWEGQEGSFLLWMLWNSILGYIVLKKAGLLERGVGLLLALTQAFLLTMILGIYIPLGESLYKIGSSPFVLLRDTMDAPIFANQNYLELISGQGLNPLLQNYWNVIHPPVMFLGFSALIFPFAYGIASLLEGEYFSWLRPARIWALFGGAVLGLGILMGAAWAYEALTFGGYWNWDPVENMILVPWLVLIGGLHTNMIAIATKQSIKSTYLFYTFAFILLLYSTYLTRSGVLGDTSNHAFTEMGLEIQMIAMIAFFALGALALLIYQYNKIPVPEKEEKTYSREFLMFLGALTIVISSILISYGTSFPVINKIVQYFDPGFAELVINDQVAHYNKHQLWIAIILGILTALAQFFRYREQTWETYRKKLGKEVLISMGLAIALTIIMSLGLRTNAWQHLLLLFCGNYAIIANLYYLGFSFKGKKQKVLSSVMSHVGYGILILGILFSGLNKRIISENYFAQSGLVGMDEESLKKNILLPKGSPIFMNGWRVEYEKDSMNYMNRYFDIHMEKMDSSRLNVKESYTVSPYIVYNATMDDIAATHPSILRGITSDIFTHITALPQSIKNPQTAHNKEDSLDYLNLSGRVGDTLYSSNHAIYISTLDNRTRHKAYEAQEGDRILSANLKLWNLRDDSIYTVNPTLYLRGPVGYTLPEEIRDLGTRIKLEEASLEEVYMDDEKLEWTELILTNGASSLAGQGRISLEDVSREIPSGREYEAKEGDVAVSATIRIEKENGDSIYTNTLNPIYVIRGSQILTFSDMDPISGIRINLESINPETEEFIFSYAQGKPLSEAEVQIAIAEDVPNSDFIVFQAIFFPGINLVWLGSLLMIAGLTLGLIYRRREKRVNPEL